MMLARSFSGPNRKKIEVEESKKRVGKDNRQRENNI
jgi:hypothetical protein